MGEKPSIMGQLEKLLECVKGDAPAREKGEGAGKEAGWKTVRIFGFDVVVAPYDESLERLDGAKGWIYDWVVKARGKQYLVLFPAYALHSGFPTKFRTMISEAVEQAFGERPRPSKGRMKRRKYVSSRMGSVRAKIEQATPEIPINGINGFLELFFTSSGNEECSSYSYEVLKEGIEYAKDGGGKTSGRGYHHISCLVCSQIAINDYGFVFSIENGRLVLYHYRMIRDGRQFPCKAKEENHPHAYLVVRLSMEGDADDGWRLHYSSARSGKGIPGHVFREMLGIEQRIARDFKDGYGYGFLGGLRRNRQGGRR